MEVSSRLHAPAVGKERLVPIGYKAGWTLESVQALQGREKSVGLAANRTPAVQPVIRRYTNGHQL
jgi:hypothetical protein